MAKKLNYRRLIKSWMRFYGLTAERSKRLFASIWMRMQSPKAEALEERSKINGNELE